MPSRFVWADIPATNLELTIAFCSATLLRPAQACYLSTRRARDLGRRRGTDTGLAIRA